MSARAVEGVEKLLARWLWWGGEQEVVVGVRVLAVVMARVLEVVVVRGLVLCCRRHRGTSC